MCDGCPPIRRGGSAGASRPRKWKFLLKPHRRTALVWLRYARILEKETQHLLRCVRPLHIRIGACRAASGPGVAATVDIPMLHNLTFAVGVGRTGIRSLSAHADHARLPRSLLEPSRYSWLFAGTDESPLRTITHQILCSPKPPRR